MAIIIMMKNTALFAHKSMMDGDKEKDHAKVAHYQKYVLEYNLGELDGGEENTYSILKPKD